MGNFVRAALIIATALVLTCIIAFASIGLLLYLFAISMVLPFTNLVISTLILAAIFYAILRKAHAHFKPKAFEVDTTVSKGIK